MGIVERAAVVVVLVLILACAGIGAVPWGMGLLAFAALSACALATLH